MITQKNARSHALPHCHKNGITYVLDKELLVDIFDTLFSQEILNRDVSALWSSREEIVALLATALQSLTMPWTWRACIVAEWSQLLHQKADCLLKQGPGISCLAKNVPRALALVLWGKLNCKERLLGLEEGGLVTFYLWAEFNQLHEQLTGAFGTLFVTSGFQATGRITAIIPSKLSARGALT